MAGLDGILRCMVLSHDPETDSITVMLASGQVIGAPIKRLSHGGVDGMRLSKGPLPGRGTWGLISFVNNDIRNGFWLGGFSPNMQDAIPSDANDPFSHYESHFSGAWSHTHGVSGHVTHQFADTSSFVVGSGELKVPVMHRHTVDENQAQKRIEYTIKDRNPSPQQPFGFAYTQATSGGDKEKYGGTTVTMNPSGDFSLTATTSGRTCKVLFNQTTMTIDPSGNYSLVAGTSGRTCTVTFNGTTLMIDKDGNLELDLTNDKNFIIKQGGGGTNDFVGLVSKLVSEFNSHVHKNVQGGQGISGPPLTNWSNDKIKSAIFKISG